MTQRTTPVIAGCLFSVLGTGPLQCSPRCNDPVPSRYDVEEIPLIPAGINRHQQIIGTTASHRAGIWTIKAGVVELPLPDGFTFSEGVAINDAGSAVLMAYDRQHTKRMALLYDGSTLYPLPGEQARAYKLDNSGQIAGEAQLPGIRTMEPVIWRHAALQHIESCCGGTVRDVNEDGIAVGNLYDRRGRYHAFQWSSTGGSVVLGAPNEYSSATAVNALGHVVVQGVRRTTLFIDGKPQPLKLAPHAPSQVRAINACDVMVGSFGPFSDADRAFRWSPARGFEDLNNSLNSRGWKLEAAVAINESGEIVGKGDHLGDDDTGFLLTPVR